MYPYLCLVVSTGAAPITGHSLLNWGYSECGQSLWQVATGSAFTKRLSENQNFHPKSGSPDADSQEAMHQNRKMQFNIEITQNEPFQVSSTQWNIPIWGKLIQNKLFHFAFHNGKIKIFWQNWNFSMENVDFSGTWIFLQKIFCQKIPNHLYSPLKLFVPILQQWHSFTGANEQGRTRIAWVQVCLSPCQGHLQW